MVAIHTALLVGCVVEPWALHRPFIAWLGWPMLAVVALSQALRWWCITTLGPRWNTRVIVVPEAPLVREGPYRWLHHPNYVAVVAEGFALPLVHTAWLTAAAFTVANAMLLSGAHAGGELRAGLHMTTYDADLLIVGGGPAGLATALHARRHGLSVIVAEPREGPIDKACGEGLMPGGLAELTSLGVDPAGMPFRGIAYLSEHQRAEARFRTGPGRGVRRTTLHAALAARAKEQDTEWIRTRVTSVEQDAHGVTAAGVRAKWLVAADGLHSAVRRCRRNQRDGRNTAALRGALALPGAGVVGVRRSVLVPLG